jgi:serine/tyrosine/threonine adenylyltransferase
MRIVFDHSFHMQMVGFYAAAMPDKPTNPELLVFNHALADNLGIDRSGCSDQTVAECLSGAQLPEGAKPIAFAYAGHQFGHFSAQLGDGRALLLGECIAPDGRRLDIQLKGSGRTAFSRNGDGKAAIGPVLREFLLSEAMHALGVPTTRSLAAVSTGDPVYRDEALPGAVLTRVASSHIRVGTFEYFAAHHGVDHVRQLADYIIARHYPAAADADNCYVAMFEAVLDAQVELIAHWMSIGFVHGVMNTDNVSIAGETIDYGPCAFLDTYAPDTVFSSIDTQGRYAFGNQPAIARWNMHRLAEALAGAVHAVGGDTAVQTLGGLIDGFADRYFAVWTARMNAKLGLSGINDGDRDSVLSLLAMMEEQGADFTLTFRALSAAQAGDDAALKAQIGDAASFDYWLRKWRERLGDNTDAARTMDAVNPLYIPRNHMVEAALEAASRHGTMEPFEALLAAVRDPYTERPGLSAYARPAPEGFGPYKTFCGT